jgi:small neutral amino acid transporter SnatA (MarC family)
MVKYLGPIPVTVPEMAGPVEAVDTTLSTSNPDRFWQSVTYVAATLMTASLAFIALAAADDIAAMAEETYFGLLRIAGGVTGLGGF